MPYCITLRSRTDTRIITGWYTGGDSRRSTDHKRQRVFDDKLDAKAVCDQLRSLCPRNAKVINIELTEDDLSRSDARDVFALGRGTDLGGAVAFLTHINWRNPL